MWVGLFPSDIIQIQEYEKNDKLPVILLWFTVLYDFNENSLQNILFYSVRPETSD